MREGGGGKDGQKGEERRREGPMASFDTFISLCLRSQNEFPSDVIQ